MKVTIIACDLCAKEKVRPDWMRFPVPKTWIVIEAVMPGGGIEEKAICFDCSHKVQDEMAVKVYPLSGEA